MPLYRLLKKSDNFEWIEEADAALQQLKAALTSPPILAAPRAEEPMLLYVAATNLAVSTVMVVERKASSLLLHALVHQIISYFPRFRGLIHLKNFSGHSKVINRS